ncbi:MAG TPA: class I SAM-dependent methyltransferase [Acidimicrobiales bacterium]|nr:class I SAM-dependent methyltransferase [Acidimicrobiales bacterium]
MTELVDKRVVDYAEAHSTASPGYLATVEAATRADFPMWGMMVGRQEGRFLELLVFALGARHVLEIGTFTGYSSISMAAGLPEGGRITTCDLDPHHVATARRNIAASPYADRIEVLEGPAIETVSGLPGPFDFVFIDADKTGYDAYFEAVLPKLAPRGLIAFDNTLFAGGVLDESNDNESAVALRRLNDKLAADPRVVVAFTTIRDGVTLVRRAEA